MKIRPFAALAGLFLVASLARRADASPTRPRLLVLTDIPNEFDVDRLVATTSMELQVQATHNPVAVLTGDRSKDVVAITTTPGGRDCRANWSSCTGAVSDDGVGHSIHPHHQDE